MSSLGEVSTGYKSLHQMEEMHLLLPIVQITVIKDKLEKTFNCLLDSGSQRSYLSNGVLDILHCHIVPVKKKKTL